jgi:hypothetical protein
MVTKLHHNEWTPDTEMPVCSTYLRAIGIFLEGFTVSSPKHPLTKFNISQSKKGMNKKKYFLFLG